ncbi:hypothetical protein [Paenibacillus xylanexedens]|uniref:hypothetical protein n=1 Tax=Paenibacillus xylanexedens TaxID=528191 RepID=UPI0011A823AC|nr:hypothetical protein [Paenibacillus xylanexedens]
MGRLGNVDFKRNDKVLIENTENCLPSHSKYLDKVGTVQILDNLTSNDATHIGVSFVLDEELHAAYYWECKQNKIMPLKPRVVMFQLENLRVV